MALANPYGAGVGPVHLRVSNRDQNGVSGNNLDVTLPPLGHTSFNLGAAVTGLAPSFAGTISIVSTDNPPLPFVAWTLFVRDGLLSPLPPGGMRFPEDDTRLPKDTLAFLKSGAATLVQALRPEDFTTPPATVIQLVRQKGLVLEASGTVSATYQTSDDSVHISSAMVDTLAGSKAALAFLIGHMVTRGVLQTTGIAATGIYANLSIEVASDVGSADAMLAAGYDPDGIADFYGRLYTASALGVPLDPFLLSEFGPLTQITSRQTQVWTSVIQGCGAEAGATQICQKAHDYWHPDYPANIP